MNLAFGESDKWKKTVKIIVFILSLIPFGHLLTLTVIKELGANPVEKIIHTTGDWALNFLLVTLSITPLSRIFGWTSLTRFRRMIGLFSIFYASLHFMTYIGIDKGFSLKAIFEDIVEHKRIIVGFTSFILLIPLAVTSTNNMVRRLGYNRWKTLHKLVYISAIGGGIHYLLLVKKDMQRPMIYAALLLLLLGHRFVIYFFDSYTRQRKGI